MMPSCLAVLLVLDFVNVSVVAAGSVTNSPAHDAVIFTNNVMFLA